MITIEEIEENVEEWLENDNNVAFNNNIDSKFKQAVYDRVENIVKIKPKFIEKILSLLKEKLSDNEIESLKRYTRITIQKYEKGEYLKPHTDNYDLHFLMILTDSEFDGLSIEDEDTKSIVFHKDEIGKVLKIKRNLLHWVNPVRGGVRYSVVIVEETDKFFNDTSASVDPFAPSFDEEGNLL